MWLAFSGKNNPKYTKNVELFPLKVREVFMTFWWTQSVNPLSANPINWSNAVSVTIL